MGRAATDPFALLRARRTLEEAGLDADVPLERASSVTNEVWLAPNEVIRVNRHPNQRLRREAFLGPKLPPDVGYPRIIAYGGEIGADWLVVERRHGDVLSRAWPGMDRDERRRAVLQLATVLRRLHEAEAPEGLPPTHSPQLLSPDTFPAVNPLLEGLEQAESLPHVDAGLITELRAAVRDLGSSIEPFASTTLIHGDLHFENVLWDGYVVTALLDFEYARPAPRDLELDVFLRFCAYPFLHVAADYEHLTRAEDYAEIPWWMADAYPELFGHPRVYDRCRLYCMAYDVRDLLETPPTRPVRDLHELHAYHRLERLLRGESHVDRYAGKTSSFTLTEAERIAAIGADTGMPSGLPPLAPGAMEERLARGGATTALPLARRAREVGAEADDTSTDAGDASPAGRPSYRVEDGVVVVEVAGAERWRGQVLGGQARLVVALPGSDRGLVLLDWAEASLPEGVMSWHPFPNLVCIEPDGEVVWRAELPDGERCYIELDTATGAVEASCFGRRCEIDPATGYITASSARNR